MGEGEQGHSIQLEDNLGLQGSRGDGKEGTSAGGASTQVCPAESRREVANEAEEQNSTEEERKGNYLGRGRGLLSMVSEAGDNHEKILDLEKTVLELKAQIDAAKRDSTGNK